MPRPTNKKCASCAFLDITESKEKTCWNDYKCKNKRNYYRSRDRKLQSQRNIYAQKQGKIPVQTFDLSPTGYRAELIMYGKQPDRNNQIRGVLKGVQILLYQGSNLILQSEIYGTAGMRASQVEELIDLNFQVLREKFDIYKFGAVIWKPNE